MERLSKDVFVLKERSSVRVKEYLKHLKKQSKLAQQSMNEVNHNL